MSRSYMRLDERPVPQPEGKRRSFDDRKEFYSDYPSMKHESDLRTVSYVSLTISLLGLVSVVVFALICAGVISIDWSFINADDIRKWVIDNYKTLSVVIIVISAVMAFSAAVVSVSCFSQEHYRRGLAAFVLMTISSAWTVVLLIISIFFIIRYMRAKGSFFS